jgi:hypothetical protein
VSGIGIAGGPGGSHARTEDLVRASAILAAAGDRMDAVASWGRAAHVAVMRDAWADPVIAAHVRDALDWINAGAGGAGAVAREIARTSRAVAETVHLLEDAERDARGLVGDLWEDAKSVARREIAMVEAVALVGAVVVVPSSIFADGGPSAVTGLPAPQMTSLADPHAIETSLGVAHAAVPFGPFSRASVADLLTFALMLSAMTLSELFGNPHGLAVEESERHVVSAPTGAAELIARVGTLYPASSDDPAQVAIERVNQPDGTSAWVVEIPGTQTFAPNGGVNPFDLTADLQMMAEGSADVMIAVAAAMEQAGIPAGDPVMLVGHSLGGIAAMALASNSSFESRYNVRSVVTAGSPIARFEPAGIASVLSLENSTDVVWALDGAPNPDRANWITVTHDLRASEDPLDRAAAASFVGSHEPATYVRTAAEFDATAAPSARAWRDANAMFLADETSVSVRTTYAITRGTEAATIPSVADHR